MDLVQQLQKDVEDLDWMAHGAPDEVFGPGRHFGSRDEGVLAEHRALLRDVRLFLTEQVTDAELGKYFQTGDIVGINNGNLNPEFVSPRAEEVLPPWASLETERLLTQRAADLYNWGEIPGDQPERSPEDDPHAYHWHTEYPEGKPPEQVPEIYPKGFQCLGRKFDINLDDLG